MDWNEKISIIISYIEDHLQRTQESIDKAEIEQIAGCSFDFFQKVFSYFYGIGFAEYIRYRKMTLAGYDLKHTGKKVIDVSYAYGYDSPTSFTKAFQSFHGVTPSKAMQQDVKLRVFPRMRVQAKKEPMKWHIKEKGVLHLLGLEKVIKKKEASREIPAFWDSCQKNGEFARLISLDEAEKKGCMGIFIEQDSDYMKYYLAVESLKPLPEGYTKLEIPAVNWAIFSCVGAVPQAIQEGWRFLEAEWHVHYPFAHADAPEIEWYSEGNAYSEDYQSEIWIPILEEEAGWYM